MQQVYVTRTLADVYLVREYLASSGVPTELRNENLFGAQGEVPVTADTLPSLWVEDELVERARELIEIHWNSDGAEATAALDAMDTDASPEAHAAMGGLFEAADRLRRGPDGAQIDQVRRLGDVIAGSPAPFGVDPDLWTRLGEMARGIATAGEQGDNDEVVALSGELRAVLRELV